MHFVSPEYIQIYFYNLILFKLLVNRVVQKGLKSPKFIVVNKSSFGFCLFLTSGELICHAPGGAKLQLTPHVWLAHL